jgi:hypothetical protein
MSLDVYYREDIQNSILAGMVFALRMAQVSKPDPVYIAGVVAMAEYQAITFGLNWPAIAARFGLVEDLPSGDSCVTYFEGRAK